VSVAPWRSWHRGRGGGRGAAPRRSARGTGGRRGVDPVKGGVLTFASDGAFTATTLPYQLLSSIDPALLPPGFQRTDPVPAVGTWRIARPIGQPDGPHSQVRLPIHEIAGQAKNVELALRGEMRDSKIILFFTIGGPDSNV
jgi:hypothetical protein